MSVCPHCESYAHRVTELEAELKDSHEDRDFVKTLWRQVQTDSGDIGAVVNTVLERVSKQSEDKDRNILQILHVKDEELTRLNKEIEWLGNKLDIERRDRDELQKDWDQKQDDLNDLINQLEEQLAVKNLELTDPDKQTKEEIVDRLDENKTQLEKQLVDMRTDLKSCVKQINGLKKRHQDQTDDNTRLQGILASRDMDIDSQKLIIADLKDNMSDKKEDNMLLKQKLEIAQNDAVGALRVLEKSDVKLRTIEKELLGVEISHRTSEESYAVSLDKLNMTISGLEDKISQLVEEGQSIRAENDKLRKEDCDNCKRKARKITALDKLILDKEKYVTLVSVVKEKCVAYLDRPLALQDIPDVVDIILADVTSSNEDLTRSTKIIKQLQLNCTEKDIMFLKLREIHDGRQERLATLQDYLSEVLDEVKLLDKDRWKALYCDFKDVCPTPQPLRHEDSSTVWTDLQFYKTVSSKLKRQLHSVEDEFDRLKLQRAIDANTVADMRAAILSDQQACDEKLRVANHHSICGCNLQLEILRDKIEELTERSDKLNTENVKLISALQTEQRRVSEMQRCRCDVADSATQTKQEETASVSTVTDNLATIRQKENHNFTNTLTLLDKLATDAQVPQHIAPPRPVPKKQPKPIRHVSTKPMATQTLTHPPIKVLQKAPAAMKIRLASLNQQVAVLTKAKHRHAKELSDEQAKMQQTENQLSAALRQVTSSQNFISSLNEDVRTANEEIRRLQDELSELQNSALRQSELATLKEKACDIKKLNHHNNLLTSQVNNLSSTIRDLQTELDDKKLAVLTLEDKLHRADKSLRQHRTDTEQLRKDLVHLKSARENSTEKLEDAKKRMQKIQDVADNRKNYIDTLKSQIQSSKVNLDQAHLRHQVCKTALDSKAKELKENARRHEGAGRVISDIQSFATKQLEEQGQKFNSVEQSMNKKLTILSKRNLQWEKCIRQAIGKIVAKIKQEKDKQIVASSLTSAEYDRAKHVSSAILDLSEADFHDIMSSTRLASNLNQTGNVTEVWKGQLAKILALEDFGPVLTNSLMQLFEEYVKVVTGETTNQSSVVTGNSLTSIESDSEMPVKLRI